jgi:hypothetical protein
VLIFKYLGRKTVRNPWAEVIVCQSWVAKAEFGQLSFRTLEAEDANPSRTVSVAQLCVRQDASGVPLG